MSYLQGTAFIAATVRGNSRISSFVPNALKGRNSSSSFVARIFKKRANAFASLLSLYT